MTYFNFIKFKSFKFEIWSNFKTEPNHETAVLMVWFNDFAARFGLVQVSKNLNGSVLTLSNRTEPLLIVSLVM